jgi:hypothetical protein
MDYRGEDLHTEDLSTGLPDVISRVDSLVAIRPNIVHNTFEALLDDWGMAFPLVGDCLAPRTALEAIFEGHAKARGIGRHFGEFTQLFLLRCMSPQMAPSARSAYGSFLVFSARSGLIGKDSNGSI